MGWEHYLRIPGFLSISRAEVNGLLSTYPSGLALDVGSGYGRISQFLRERGFMTLSIDVDRRMVDVCKEGGLDTVRMDAPILAFPDNIFDLVVSDGLLEHYFDPSPILREEARVAKGFVVNFIPKISLMNTILEKVQRVPREIRRGKEEWAALHKDLFSRVEIIELKRLYAVKCSV